LLQTYANCSDDAIHDQLLHLGFCNFKWRRHQNTNFHLQLRMCTIFCRTRFLVAACAHSDPFPAAFCGESSQKRSALASDAILHGLSVCQQNVCGVRDAACAPYLHNVKSTPTNTVFFPLWRAHSPIRHTNQSLTLPLKSISATPKLNKKRILASSKNP
jgi:hypothetical protein